MTETRDPQAATNPTAPVIVWFRRDLRLGDNPALADAVRSGRPILPVYILDETDGLRAPGAASRWWLGKSLAQLAASLEALGSRLILRRGVAAVELMSIVRETGAARVVWNRLYDPGVTDRDAALKAALRADGVAAHSFNSGLLSEPWTVRNKAGEPFKVFSPFWRAAQAGLDLTQLHPAPGPRTAPALWPDSQRLETWNLQPTTPDWTGGFALWTPGETGAQTRLSTFLETGLAHYTDGRNIPAAEAVSRLSPHLHFGEISPRQIWAAVDTAIDARPALGRQADKFKAELGWREFSHSLLFHNPQMETRNFKAAFDAFPWRDDPVAFAGLNGQHCLDRSGHRHAGVTGGIAIAIARRPRRPGLRQPPGRAVTFHLIARQQQGIGLAGRAHPLQRLTRDIGQQHPGLGCVDHRATEVVRTGPRHAQQGRRDQAAGRAFGNRDLLAAGFQHRADLGGQGFQVFHLCASLLAIPPFAAHDAA